MRLPSLESRLWALDTCTVSDALDHLHLLGAVTGMRRVSSEKRIAGRVVTVRLRPVASERPARHLGAGAIEAARPGDVIVVDHGARIDMAGWGGLLSTAAQLRGVVGVIIDGACRDLDEINALGFPVFARSETPLTGRGRVVEESFNQAILVGSVTVRPGDLVIADGSGVVFLPGARAEQIVGIAEAFARREAAILAELRAGTPVSQALGAEYESLIGSPPR